MNTKGDAHSSSNEEVQSSGISSMSDEGSPSENGAGNTERLPEEYYMRASDQRMLEVNHAHQNALNYTQQVITNPYGARNNSERFTRDPSGLPDSYTLPETLGHREGFHATPGMVQKSHFPPPPNFGMHGGPFPPGYQGYTQFGDTDRQYYLDSDLETIEEESSVLESDMDDRSSIGYDRKRSAEFHNVVRHSRSGSTGSTPSNSQRDSMTSAITASDDERSSSTLSSSMSPKRSSTSSRSDRATPNSETRDRRVDSEQRAAVTYTQKGRNFEKGPGIDPNAQQKIVYAKCLSPKEAENASSKRSEKKQVFQFSPTQNGPHRNSSHQKSTHSTHKRRQSKELTITDMFEAVRKGDVHTLNKFSDAEQSETVDERGNTVLHAAADSGQLQCIQMLANGPCKEAVSLLNDDMMTPAALSVKNGHLCCVQWLVQNTRAKDELIVSSRQASIDGSNMRPPLAHVAARYDQDIVLDWICEEMVRENFHIDSADNHSNTAVHEAASYGRLRCLQTLVSRGASVTVLNSNGDTPGQVADKNGHDLCLGYLVVVETCMSLAQQLITLKMENEEVKKDNEALKTQMQQNVNAIRMIRAQSVEDRIKATIQNLSPYAEDNEPQTRSKLDQDLPLPPPPSPPPQPNAEDERDYSFKPAEPAPKAAGQTVEIAAASVPQTTNHQLPAGAEIAPNKQKPADKQSQLFARFAKTKNSVQETQIDATKIEPQGVAVANATQAPVQQSKLNVFNAATKNRDGSLPGRRDNRAIDVASAKESVDVRQNDGMAHGTQAQRSTNAAVQRQPEKTVPKIIEPLRNGYDEQADNEEIVTLTSGLNGKAPPARGPSAKPGPNSGPHGARAWEKMAMDEMLRMARDTRNLPSPTISMCTEDSTMETREQMRERLAEASRWFLGQYGHGPGSRHPPAIKQPLVKPAVQPIQPTVIRHHDPGETKPKNEKSMNSTANWVLGVQKPNQPNRTGPKPFKAYVPQQFVTATNQQYRKIQLDLQKKSEAQSRMPSAGQSHSLPPNVRLDSGAFDLKSPSASSVSSLSSTTLSSPNRFDLSPSSPSTRPTSAKSSCSNASTVKSNAINSSSSSVSAASQDTVVENGVDGARWRSNAELVERQHIDPLQKRRTPIASDSPSSMNASRSVQSNRSISAIMNDAISGNDVAVSRAYDENPLAAGETAEIRTNLPPRNNSFLRKVQPAGPSLPSHIDYSPVRVQDHAAAQQQTHVVTYPAMSLKPPVSVLFKSNTREIQSSQVRMTSNMTSMTHSANTKISTAEAPQKVEIVSPNWRAADNKSGMSGRNETVPSGKGFHWKASSTKVTRHEQITAVEEVSAPPPPKVEKDKRVKREGSSTKLPYGGLFSSTNSPKTNTKKKGTRLFHF